MIPHPIITAAFILTAIPASAVTLLLNPDFEAIALAPATSVTVTDADFEEGETSPQVAPWASGGNSVYLASAGANSGVWGSSTRFNSQFVVLANFSDGATFSNLVQSFALGAAGTFNFSFDWESPAYTEANTNGYSTGGFGLLSMRIHLPGGGVAAYTEILTGNSQQGTLSASAVVLPEGPAAIEIRYEFESGGGAYNHVFLDNVQVTVVPEPSTSLVAAALAGLACLRRRR
jgi:hypothetical protein